MKISLNFKRKMSLLNIMIKDLPKWIQTGEYYNLLDDKDELIEIASSLIKEDDSISNLDEFKQVVSICLYWVIQFPPSVYNYSFVEEDEVLQYLLSLSLDGENQYLSDSFDGRENIERLISMINNEPIITFSSKNQLFHKGIILVIELKIKDNFHGISFYIHNPNNEVKVKQLKTISSSIRNGYQFEHHNCEYHDNDYYGHSSSSCFIDENNIYQSTRPNNVFIIGRNRYRIANYFDKLS